jgi:protein involved in polysaccharide export with SLBB domain
MKRLALFSLGFLLVLALATLAAEAQHPAQSRGIGSLTATGPVDPLRPGDVVRVRIWRETDLSGDFLVDENGVVMLPKLGPTQVTHEPIDRLRAQLMQAYQMYLHDSSIEIIPMRRIRVTGAVRNPGLYTVDPTVTVADALALAGGATPQGKRDRVLLIRGEMSIDARLSPSEDRTLSPLRSGDQLFVPERSWISRNPRLVIGAVSATASMIWAVSRLQR